MANEQLIVSLEARIRDFERQMKRANTTATKQFSAIERRGQQMTSRLQGMGKGSFAALARGATLALAPILSIGAAINTAKAALSDFDSIAKSAKASGLDGETFQEFAYAAELGGVSTDQFAKALETLSRNAGLAAIGKGELIEKLKQLNPELLKNILATSDQATRVRLAADAINRAGSASEKAALAATLFGDAGVRMVEVFNGGSAALAETAKKARELGLVIDNDLLRRAETMNDEFETATRVMDLQFKQALIDLAPFLISTAQLAGNLASAIGYITDSMQDLALRGTARLEEDLANIDATLAQAGTNFAPGVVGTMGLEMDPEATAALQAERDAIFAELKRRAMDQLRIELAKPPVREDGDGGGGGGGGGRNASADATIRQAEAVQKLIADLQFEKQIIGESALEQEILNELRRAGVDATSAEGQAIRGLVTELDAQKTAIAATADAMREFEGIATNALSSFISDLREGKSGADALSNALNSVLDNVIQIGIQSLVGGLFGGGGGLFAGLFAASGGHVSGPGTGTSDSIPARLSDGEFVVNAKATKDNLALLHAINSGKGYAAGGYVGAPTPIGAARSMEPMRITIEVQEGAAFSTRVLEVSGPASAEISSRTVRGYDADLSSRTAEKAMRFQ